jgi:hypothetical protein
MQEQLLSDAVRSLARIFHNRQVKHALIGGLAVGVRGRPRATKDADFLLQVPALAFPGLLEELIADGFEMDLLPTIRRWTTDRLIVFHRGPARIDWMQTVLPLYDSVLKTAMPSPWLDQSLYVASAEGLILTKLVAFRLQDQADIAALLISNRDTIDLDWIRAEWNSYVQSEPERTRWLEQAIVQYVPRQN